MALVLALSGYFLVYREVALDILRETFISLLNNFFNYFSHRLRIWIFFSSLFLIFLFLHNNFLFDSFLNRGYHWTFSLISNPFSKTLPFQREFTESFKKSLQKCLTISFWVLQILLERNTNNNSIFKGTVLFHSQVLYEFQYFLLCNLFLR